MADKSVGWAGWLMKRLRGQKGVRPRLELLERITIGPRQTAALIEAEGRRALVVCSAEGSPAIYPLASRAESGAREQASRSAQRMARISW